MTRKTLKKIIIGLFGAICLVGLIGWGTSLNQGGSLEGCVTAGTSEQGEFLPCAPGMVADSLGYCCPAEGSTGLWYYFGPIWEVFATILEGLARNWAWGVALAIVVGFAVGIFRWSRKGDKLAEVRLKEELVRLQTQAHVKVNELANQEANGDQFIECLKNFADEVLVAMRRANDDPANDLALAEVILGFAQVKFKVPAEAKTGVYQLEYERGRREAMSLLHKHFPATRQASAA